MPSDPKYAGLKNTVGKALGRIPSGLFILTARDGGQTLGMLVSWVQQAAFDPPAVSVAIGRDRPARELILRTRRFALSVLPEGSTDLMRRFARTTDRDPFDGLPVEPAPSGLPIIAGALAWLDCELMSSLDFGADHELFLGRVSAGQLLRPGPSFMHVRGNGFHY